MPAAAMVLAAGLGQRMRPLTDRRPKPLIEVNGKSLIDHGLDALERCGVAKAVVNLHHFPEQMVAHLSRRNLPKIVFSDETAQLLDSGGGILKALDEFGGAPFFVLNADTFWIEGFKPNLARLSAQWDPARMDLLLLVSGMANAVGYGGKGDFTMDPLGRLQRRGERLLAPFAYAGAAIVDPGAFDGAPPGPFSLNLIFDRALERQRLFGLRLEGLWLHVGTPEAVREAEAAIARSSA